MKIIATYYDRMKMLDDYPTIDKTKWIVIEDDEIFARFNEIEGNEMIWAEAKKLHEADVMPELPDGLDDDSNCDHNFKLGWIACWNKIKGKAVNKDTNERKQIL